MGIPIWSIPDELAHFIQNQFKRFGVPEPDWKLIDEAGVFVSQYVARYNYFPYSPHEATHRFHQSPGLREDEKYKLVGPLEVKMFQLTRMQYDIRYIELAAWAALMWCWSEEGIGHTDWVFKTEIQPELSLRDGTRLSMVKPAFSNVGL